MRAGDCPVVVAQWQSTVCTGQRCPGFIHFEQAKVITYEYDNYTMNIIMRFIVTHKRFIRCQTIKGLLAACVVTSLS